MIVKYNHNNQQGGLYFETSFCSHSCRPNVAIKPWDNGGQLRLFAIRGLAAGEKLTMTFVNPTMERTPRRLQLLHEYGVKCHCPRCLDDSDLPHDELALLMGDDACTVM
eukprot:5651789-Amphidinium_carterae.1